MTQDAAPWLMQDTARRGPFPEIQVFLVGQVSDLPIGRSMHVSTGGSESRPTKTCRHCVKGSQEDLPMRSRLTLICERPALGVFMAILTLGIGGGAAALARFRSRWPASAGTRETEREAAM